MVTVKKTIRALNSNKDDNRAVDAKDDNLNSALGTRHATHDTEDIANALKEAIAEDPDTPTALVSGDGYTAYIQPASYQDNVLIKEGNFSNATVYVSILGTWGDIIVDDAKMQGSSVSTFISDNAPAPEVDADYEDEIAAQAEAIGMEDVEPGDNETNYNGYIIDGSESSGYVVFAPYGKYAPGVYKTIDEAKAVIDEDLEFIKQKYGN